MPVRYRADIDGLRAIAITLVLLFHAFPKAFPGGFVGVDVFFVISGFLITRNILFECGQNRFSLLEFYKRRFRRLVPSLVLVLLVTAAIGRVVLFSDEIRTLTKHIASGLFFVSNFRLLGESGYFDVAAETKPLLHLWSLAIEEQFYLFWPMLVILIGQIRRRLAIVALILIAGSFLGNLLFIGSYPSHVFYLPFTRFWEIFVGCLIAFVFDSDSRVLLRARWSTFVSAVGFALIGIGYLLASTSKFAFPGWVALFPTVGAGLLIALGKDSWMGRNVLSHRSLVGVGVLSYSLYLWHWPLLSYSNIVFGGNAPYLVQSFLIGLSIVLSYLTHHLVEVPIQKKKKVPVKTLSLATCCLVLVAIYLNAKSPQINPTPESIGLWKNMNSFVEDGCGKTSDPSNVLQYCMRMKNVDGERSEYLLIGDSKAHALYSGLVLNSARGQSWTLMSRDSCAPMVGLRRISFYSDDGVECEKSNRLMLDAIKSEPKVKTVVVAVAARVLLVPQYAPENESGPVPVPTQGLSRLIHEIESLNKNIVFLIDNPTLPTPATCIPRVFSLNETQLGNCSISMERHREVTRDYAAIVDDLRQNFPRLKVVDPTPVLCDGGECSIQKDGKYLYSYDDHLSDFGASLVAKKIREVIAEERL